MRVEDIVIGQEYRLEGVGLSGTWKISKIEFRENGAVVVVSKNGKSRVVSPEQVLAHKEKRVMVYLNNSPTINGYTEFTTSSGRVFKIADAWNLPISKRGRPKGSKNV